MGKVTYIEKKRRKNKLPQQVQLFLTYVYHTHFRDTDESGMEVAKYTREKGVSYQLWLLHNVYVHHKFVKWHTCNMPKHTFKQELTRNFYDV